MIARTLAKPTYVKLQIDAAKVCGTASRRRIAVLMDRLILRHRPPSDAPVRRMRARTAATSRADVR